jgi:NAD(P)-dependent dehydrogenase (short-subunit alcohol dehydrogenase family)
MTHPDHISQRFRLDGKVALITGASKGIGAAMARGLAESGARVVLSSRKQESVDAVAQTLRDDGLEAIGIAANMGKLEDTHALVEQIPLGRLGETEDLAGLAVYLASAASAYCSGGIYMVDGGYSAN